MRSVFRWLADFANGGQNALLSKPIPRRSPKVGEEEVRWLAKAVKNNTPLQFKFVFGLWTLTLVGAWETEIYPAIRAEAKAVGATIYFADESGIRSDYHTGTTTPQSLRALFLGVTPCYIFRLIIGEPEVSVKGL